MINLESYAFEIGWIRDVVWWFVGLKFCDNNSQTILMRETGSSWFENHNWAFLNWRYSIYLPLLHLEAQRSSFIRFRTDLLKQLHHTHNHSSPKHKCHHSRQQQHSGCHSKAKTDLYVVTWPKEMSNVMLLYTNKRQHIKQWFPKI